MSTSSKGVPATTGSFQLPAGRDTGNRPSIDSPLHASCGWQPQQMQQHQGSRAARANDFAEFGDKSGAHA